MGRVNEDWCILRTSSRTTMSLAESLVKDGYEAWTPIETRTIRVPRMNIRREVKQPIMPSYVFARAHHLIDLLELAEMPVKPRRGAGLMEPAHANFSVLHAFGRIPLVADRHLSDLRRIEFKRTPTKKAKRSLPLGIGVKVKGGSFGGIRGIVERSDTSHTVVCINDRYTVKIATSLLDPDELCVSSIDAVLRAA